MYDVSYILSKEAGGQVVSKFFRKKEPMHRTSSEKDEGTSRLKIDFGKTNSNAKGMDVVLEQRSKQRRFGCGDNSKRNIVPRTKETKKYREEVMDATASFHRFRITYLPKALSPKAEVLIGLATIKLEFLNQEVSVGVKTRPLVEVEDNNKGRGTTEKAAVRKPNFIWENSRSN
ncbi:hypothetical protein Tco_0746935 [Tanacetum coccineum]